MYIRKRNLNMQLKRKIHSITWQICTQLNATKLINQYFCNFNFVVVVESKDPNQVSANPASDQNVKKSVVKDKPKDDGSSSSSDSEEEKKKEDKPQKSSVKRKSIKKK